MRRSLLHRPNLARALLVPLVLGLILPVTAPPAAQAGVEQPGFTDSAVLAGLVMPTAVEFALDGRVFVAEKSGIIRVFPSIGATASTVFADLRPRVHDFWDRGLLGLALHPNFPTDNRVFVSYTYDAPIGGTAPTWGDGCPNPPGATAGGCVVSGRLSVFEATGSVGSTEEVLIEDWCQQYPSHSIGDLAFGADGALYVSAGDGASFNFADYGQIGNVCGDPPSPVGGAQTIPTAEGGALRSQDLRTSGDPVTLDGSILRVDPDTGLAMAGNPLASDPDPNARRIVATGLRNPFRITSRPGTSEIWLADVGWGSWEEVNRLESAAGGPVNFGWPCFEGDNHRLGAYESLDICQGLYDDGIGTVAAPHLTYRHGQPVVGESCQFRNGSSISGLAFYEGGAYPSAYDGALFVSDYSRSCIWVAFAGSDGLPDPATLAPFITDAGSPVQLKTGPGGDLFYVNFNDGAIHRVRHGVANQPPIARITADPTIGIAPLTVTFDGSASSDPDGGPLDYAWDLDNDGVYDDGTDPTATHTYSGGTHSVGLRVTDAAGVSGLATVLIRAGGTTYLSDLPFTLEINGWGPLERDRSNGENGASDGGPLSVAGQNYERGLGVHAASDVRLQVPAGCTTFRAVAGMDDEVGDLGSVRFAVWVAGSQRLQTPLLSGASPAETIEVAVTPGAELRLVVSTEGGPDHDHADWADARLTCAVTGSTPPTARIDAPTSATTWAVEDAVAFSGGGDDAEDGSVAVDGLRWSLILHHCNDHGGCHEHPIQTLTGVDEGTFSAPDHPYPSHLEVRLTVTDSDGSSDTTSVLIHPKTVDLTLLTSPPGLELVVGADAAQAAPREERVIVNSVTTISAASTQTLGGTTYRFVSWSDGGPASHEVTAGVADETFTATYEPITAPDGTTYLSDLPFTLEINGWGPLERDRSNGENGASDGGPLSVAGQNYERGLGVHAASDVRLQVPAGCTTFRAVAGMDDEVGDLGSVRFAVWVAGSQRLQTPLLSGASPAETIEVAVTPGAELRLVVSTEGGPDHDHADWADARLTCGDVPPPPPLLFGPATSNESGTETHGVTATDLNGDGVLDLVGTNAGASDLTIFIGRGNGSILASGSFDVGFAPKMAAAADVDGDGRMDLVTADQNSDTVSVLLGDGSGGFASALPFTACKNPHEVALADFDADGEVDIAVACWGDDELAVLLGGGDGSFADMLPVDIDASSHSIVSADFNGDGRPDLATANNGNATVSVLLGDGDGTFGPVTRHAAGDGPHSIRSADVNGDGARDLATANEGSDDASILLGDGAGGFDPAINVPSGLTPKGVALGDVNGDGLIDLVTANTAGSYPVCCNPGGNTVSVMLGVGDGSFGSTATHTVGLTPFAAALADLDADGDLDLATANWHSGDVSVLKNLTHADAPDNDPPTVESVDPDDDAEDVPTDSSITITFSEPMLPSSVTSSTLILEGDGSAVDADVTYDGATRTATLEPQDDLEAGATYTATARGGAGGLRDLVGNALAADRTWTFSTQPPPPTNEPPVLGQPADQASDEGAAVSLQLAATDPDNDPMTFAASGFPPGVTVDPASGLVSGTVAAASAAGSPYAVTASVADGRGGSDEVSFAWVVTAPPAAPPDAPTGLGWSPTTSDVRLAWDANDEPNVVGYLVRRATAAAGPFQLLTPSPGRTPSHVDPDPPLAGTLWYRVSAVTAAGLESEPTLLSVARPIRLVGSAFAVNAGQASLRMTRPTGTQAGDFLIATVTIPAARAITAPAGWAHLRTDTRSSNLRQAVFYRFVASSEPPEYTWTFAHAAAAVGSVTGYRGVDPARPVDVHTGRSNGSSTSIATSRITTRVDSAVVVGLFGIARDSAVGAPALMESLGGRSLVVGSQRLAVGIADLVRPIAGRAPVLTATVPAPAVSIGQLVALRPSGP